MFPRGQNAQRPAEAQPTVLGVPLTFPDLVDKQHQWRRDAAFTLQVTVTVKLSCVPVTALQGAQPRHTNLQEPRVLPGL